MNARSARWAIGQGCRLTQWQAQCLLRRIESPPRFASSSSAGSLEANDIYDVVCVGGGPAGLSLLAGLRASPITSSLRIALVESLDLCKNTLAADTPLSQFSNRCSSLTPSSVAYLKRIGAWDTINQERVQPYQEMQVWDGISGSRISFDWQETFSRGWSMPMMQQAGPPSRTIAYMIENLNLVTGLQKRLRELGGVEQFSPVRVEGITSGEQASPTELDFRSWPLVRLSDGRTLAARLLVGADGANSPVRTFAGINAHGWEYNRHGLVATLRLAGTGKGSYPNGKVAYQRFLPTGPAAMLPLPGNMATLVWSTLPERAAKLKSLSKADLVATINAAFRLSPVDLTYLHSIDAGQAEEVAWRLQHTPFDEALVPEEVIEVQEGTVASFPLKLRHADTYTSERIALIGDAAHTIHPLAGQGLNQGQGDVAALIRTIEEAVQSGQDIGSQLALESYNAERYAANNALLGVCDKLHKLYSFEAAPIVGLRSLGLDLVNSIGFAKEFLMKRAAGA